MRAGLVWLLRAGATMSVIMKGNYILVQPGEKAFKVASNCTHHRELGHRCTADYDLEAKVLNDEFVVSATLPGCDGKGACRIVNCFPEAPGLRREMTPSGYRIFDQSGLLLFGLR